MLFVAALAMVVVGFLSQTVFLTRLGLLTLALAVVLAGLQRLNAELGGDDFRGPE